MGFFSKILGGNDSQTIVRCDEAEFLIWKYQGGAVKSGTSLSRKMARWPPLSVPPKLR